MKSDLFHNKPQLRILELTKLLRRAGGLTKAEICSRLGISTRTFHNDIQHLRTDLDAPIGYDYRVSREGGKEYFWFLRDRDWSPEPMQVREGDLFALLLARQILDQFEGMPVGEKLKEIYERLAGELHEKVTIHPDELADISFAPGGTQSVKPTVWNAVLEAVRRRRSLAIEYESAWKGETKPRVIDPYHVVNLQGSWYLIGTSGEGDGVFRQYALDRIKRIKVSDSAFVAPADFDIRMILDNTFGRFIGDPYDLVEVEVRFSKTVSPLVRDRRFHPLQKSRTDGQGRITLSFPVTPSGATPRWRYYHVRSWVLSWGPDVEVLAPEELKKLIRGDLGQMMRVMCPEKGAAGGKEDGNGLC